MYNLTNLSLDWSDYSDYLSWNSTSYTPLYRPWLWGVFAPFLAIGTFANGVVIITILNTRRLQNRSNIKIFLLSMVEVVSTLTVALVTAIDNVQGLWPLGSSMCQTWIVLDLFLGTMSILLVLVVAMDRLEAVRNPFTYRLGRSAAWKHGVGAWIVTAAVSLCISLPSLSLPVDTMTGHCAPFPSTWFTILSALAVFFLPFTAILAIYCQVFTTARGVRRGVHGPKYSMELNISSNESSTKKSLLSLHQLEERRVGSISRKISTNTSSATSENISTTTPNQSTRRVSLQHSISTVTPNKFTRQPSLNHTMSTPTPNQSIRRSSLHPGRERQVGIAVSMVVGSFLI